MGLSDFLFGSSPKSPKLKQVPTMSPDQMRFFRNFLSQLGQVHPGAMDAFSQYLDPSSEAYDRFEAPYMRQFEEETLPMLAERFAGMGGGMGGGLSSSGFAQSLGSAGAGMSERLAALRSQLQQQAAQQLLGQGNVALGTQPFAYYEKGGRKGTSGLLGGFASSLGQGLQGSIGGILGNIGGIFGNNPYEDKGRMRNSFEQGMY